jgi:hypothetical protein
MIASVLEQNNKRQIAIMQTSVQWEMSLASVSHTQLQHLPFILRSVRDEDVKRGV